MAATTAQIAAAAVGAAPLPKTHRRPSAATSSSSWTGPEKEIRYKELAHYVGLSMVREPSLVRTPPKALSKIRAASAAAAPAAAQDLDDLPSDSHLTSTNAKSPNKAAKLRTQIEWLHTQQVVEREYVRKLDHSLSDTMLLEQRAKKRLLQQEEMRKFHAQRAVDVERRIAQLREQLAAEVVPLSRQQSQLSSSRHSSGSASEAAPSPPSPVGLLAKESAQAQPPSPKGAKGPKAWANTATAALAATGPSGGAQRSCALWAPAQRKAREPREPFDAAGSSSSNAPPAEASTGSEAGSAFRSADGAGRTRKRSPSREPQTLPPPPAPDQAGIQHMRQQWRERIRTELRFRAGGAREAFRKIDLNGSGNISSQEFADGVARLGVNWQQITGLSRPRDLFSLFDQDKDALIIFGEFFPEETDDDGVRPATPDFCQAYFRSRLHELRGPEWTPHTSDDELQVMFDISLRNDMAAEKKKWMGSTIRRLKCRGKSDARCREVVALHLPRGSGPKDREGVNTFTKLDLKNCRKAYTDKMNAPIRRLQKVIGDYKDQKREQKRIYDRLYSVTEAERQRQRAEEMVSSLGIGGMGLLGGKAKDEPANDRFATHQRCLECGMAEDQVDELYKEFEQLADAEDTTGKRGFVRLLQALASGIASRPSPEASCTGRALKDSDTDAWWEQACRKTATDDVAGTRRLSFDQFAQWYAGSEARAA